MCLVCSRILRTQTHTHPSLLVLLTTRKREINRQKSKRQKRNYSSAQHNHHNQSIEAGRKEVTREDTGPNKSQFFDILGSFSRQKTSSALHNAGVKNPPIVFSRQKTSSALHDASVKNLPIVFPAKKRPPLCNAGLKNLPVVFPAKKRPALCMMPVWRTFLLFFPLKNVPRCVRCRFEEPSHCFSRQKWHFIHPRHPEIFHFPLIPIRIRITRTTRTMMKPPFYCNRIRKRFPWGTPLHPIGRSRRLYFTSKTILMPRTLNAAGENGSLDGSFSPVFLPFYFSV